MNYLNLVFVLIVQLNLIRQQLRAADIRPFRCDSKETVNWILSEKAKRMTTSQGRIFLIYQHKILSFRFPFFFMNNGSLLHYVSSPIFEQDANEADSNDTGLRPVGSLVNVDKSETFEIVLKGETELQVRRLDFSGTPGKRTTEVSKLPFDNYERYLNTAQDLFANLQFLFVSLSEKTGEKLFFEYESKSLFFGHIDGDNTQGESISLPYAVDYGKRSGRINLFNFLSILNLSR